MPYTKPNQKTPKSTIAPALWPSIITLLLDLYWKESETLQNKRIRKAFGASALQMEQLRENEKFKAKYQMALAERNLEGAAIPIARRQERLLALQVLYNQLPEEQVKYKLLCLKLAREEEAAMQPEMHLYAHVDVPPKAKSYEQWIKQRAIPLDT